MFFDLNKIILFIVDYPPHRDQSEIKTYIDCKGNPEFWLWHLLEGKIWNDYSFRDLDSVHKKYQRQMTIVLKQRNQLFQHCQHDFYYKSPHLK